MEGLKSLFAEVPITALSKSTLRQLSALLNSKKNLRSHEGYDCDWRGIAALAQIKSHCDEAALSNEDAIATVLQLWSSHNSRTATLEHLERFLGIIERWSVFDEIHENLVEDTKNYKAKLRPITSDRSDEDEADGAQNDSSDDICDKVSDPNILTTDDVLRAQKGLPLQQYDAFVLFADVDINYALELLAELEDNHSNNFKLCLRERDLLSDVCSDHVALTELIEQRCKQLIVILTEDFMKSPENKFLVRYMRALQKDHKTRQIIPLLYEESVNIPKSMISTHINYNTKANFWGVLSAAIRNVNVTKEIPTMDLVRPITTDLQTKGTVAAINGNVASTEDVDTSENGKKRIKHQRRVTLHHYGKSSQHNELDCVVGGGVGAGYIFNTHGFRR